MVLNLKVWHNNEAKTKKAIKKTEKIREKMSFTGLLIYNRNLKEVSLEI